MSADDPDDLGTADITATSLSKKRRANGNGTVWFVKDKRRSPWAAAVVRGWTPSGKAIKSTRFFATEEEAIAGLEEMVYRRDAGLVMPSPAVVRWIMRRKAKGKPGRPARQRRPQTAAISSRLRFDVLARDDFACTYCGRRPPEVVLQIDHIRPVALSGDTSMDNLTTACRECNAGKAARYTTDF